MVAATDEAGNKSTTVVKPSSLATLAPAHPQHDECHTGYALRCHLTSIGLTCRPGP